jgi:hypothetical protein
MVIYPDLYQDARSAKHKIQINYVTEPSRWDSVLPLEPFIQKEIFVSPKSLPAKILKYQSIILDRISDSGD